MILRDLVTRFSFETDESGIAKYNNKLAGMRKGLGRFLGLLGVGLGAKELFDVGQNAKQAEFNLRRFVGTDFTKLRQQFFQTQKDINKLREGAGDLIIRKDFDLAAGKFFQTFGRGQKQMEDFSKFWDFAAKQSALTGQNVNSIFEQLQSGVRGGDFGSLLNIPGIDVFRKQLLEFQNQVLDPNEPGGRIAIQNRMRTFFRIIQQARAEQDKSLTELPAGILESRKTVTEFREAFEKLGKTVNELLVPALQQLNKLLEIMNKGFGFAEKNTDSIKSGVGRFFEGFDPVYLASQIDPIYRVKQLRDAISGTGQFEQSNRPSAGSQINMTNNFTVYTNDSEDAANKVLQKLDQKYKDAAKAIPKTEDR